MTTSVGTELRDGTWSVLVDRTTASFQVRQLGLIRVRGTIAVTDGNVTVASGRPVAATASLEAASAQTGIKKRDVDLLGRRFFSAAAHPAILVRVGDVRPDGPDWTAAATITVAGGQAPLALRLERAAAEGDGTLRVRATGVLDRRDTRIGAPRWLIGRWVAVDVDATLRLSG